MFKKQVRATKKVRIKTPIAGGAEPMYDLPDFGFTPGQVVELDSRLAESWIASGVAEPVQ